MTWFDIPAFISTEQHIIRHHCVHETVWPLTVALQLGYHWEEIIKKKVLIDNCGEYIYIPVFINLPL